MLVYGTAVTDRALYEREALRGIRRVAESDSAVLVREGHDSIQQPYNELLAEAAALPGIEALVLLHQDLELTDGSLPARARALLAEPRVGAIGAFGARAIEFHRDYGQRRERLFGLASIPGFQMRHSSGAREVDVLDGSLLVVAPWAARAIRFDERLARHFHGYDMDFCERVRAAGGKVVCDDIPHVHHMRRRWSSDDRAALRAARLELARAWDPALRPAEWEPAFTPAA